MAGARWSRGEVAMTKEIEITVVEKRDTALAHSLDP